MGVAGCCAGMICVSGRIAAMGVVALICYRPPPAPAEATAERVARGWEGVLGGCGTGEGSCATCPPAPPHLKMFDFLNYLTCLDKCL